MNGTYSSSDRWNESLPPPRIEEARLRERALPHELSEQHVGLGEQGLVRVEPDSRRAHGVQRLEQLQPRHAARDVVERDLRVLRDQVGERDRLSSWRLRSLRDRVGHERHELGVEREPLALSAASIGERLDRHRRLVDRSLQRSDDHLERLVEALLRRRSRIRERSRRRRRGEQRASLRLRGRRAAQELVTPILTRVDAPAEGRAGVEAAE
jgi:hypothetical protein